MKLSYSLLPGRSSSLPKSDLVALAKHNYAFQFWKSQWDHVFQSLDGSATKAADFTRHDVVAILMGDDSILALHQYSVFRLDSEADMNHHYALSSYEAGFFEGLQKRNIHSVMSMEYLTVSPEVRRSASLKSAMPFSIAHLILGLGMCVLKDLKADAAIGACRHDLKVDRLAVEFGAFLGDVRQMHNVPVVSAAISRLGIKPCERPEERAEIERLWREREDLTSTNAKVVDISTGQRAA